MKKTALIFSVFLATLFFSFSKIVSAEETTEASKTVHITKTFITPDPNLVTLPDEFSFNFSVEKAGFYPYGSDEQDSSVTVPDISDQTLTFNSASDTGTVSNGVKTTYKQTADLLSGLTFPKAGIYYYTISESKDTVTLTDSDSESLEYSDATYILKVYVSRDEDGNTVIDGGTVENSDNEKVDPSPTDDVDGGGSNEVISANGFNFTNIYTKDAGSVTPPDTDNTEAGLVITKTIEGDLSNASDEFTYSFTLAKNALVADKTYTLVTPTENITVTPGAEVTFKLKGGEKALLLNVPAGASFNVTETDFGYYTPSNTLLLNSIETGNSSNVTAGGLLGENSNKVDYKNTWNKTTPTGVILNNLPFILLIVLSASGLFAVYVTKKRHV